MVNFLKVYILIFPNLPEVVVLRFTAIQFAVHGLEAFITHDPGDERDGFRMIDALAHSHSLPFA
jgi:hypothetical protein